MKVNYLFKYFFVGFIGMSILLFSTSVFAHQENYDQCNENNPENCPFPSPICDNGEHVGNPHCDEVTITPTPTEDECYEDECEPTVTPDITAPPTAELTPTPTDVHHNPSDEKFDIHGDGGSDGKSSAPQPTHYPGYEQTGWK